MAGRSFIDGDLMYRLSTLFVFLMITVATAVLASQFIGGEWHHAMKQPVWVPPAGVMAALWAVAYVVMAVAAWLVWGMLRGLALPALTWWGMQLLASVLWSWVFFGLHRIGWSMAVLGLWLLLVLTTAKSFRAIRLAAFLLMLILVVWVLFLLGLNFQQWLLNGGGLTSAI